MRLRITVCGIALSIAASPAAADVAPTACRTSLEIGQNLLQNPTYPERPIRIEVLVKGGVEHVVDAPPEILRRALERELERTRDAPSPNASTGYVGMVLNRRPGVEHVKDKIYGSTHVMPMDGRYAVLALERRSQPSPSSAEQARDCNGKDEADAYTSMTTSFTLVAERCDGSCRGATLNHLIDKAYGQPQRQTFTVVGRKRLTMRVGAQDPRPFATRLAALDADHISNSIRGLDGYPFHPEMFTVTGEVREMKPQVLDQWERIPLVVAVTEVIPCPTGDTAMRCAPEETASRVQRVRGYPDGAHLGTFSSLPPMTDADKEEICNLPQACLATYFQRHHAGERMPPPPKDTPRAASAAMHWTGMGGYAIAGICLAGLLAALGGVRAVRKR